MSREVDVKALISHIVSGDGIDKCRICMGDTSEGQVFLGDTVMMDGDRPVTLAELLEVITGVEVLDDDMRPNTLCSQCSESAINAANFSLNCQQVENQWDVALNLLQNIPSADFYAKETKTIYAILNNDRLTIVTEKKDDVPENESEITDIEAADQQPSNHPPRKIPKYKENKRISTKICHCKCPTCGKQFQFARNLSSHLKESGDLLRACHICAQVMYRDELVIHLIEAHQIKPYPCKKCPALFHLQMKYIKHMKTAHTSGICTCGECGRTFQTLSGYHAHQSLHIPKTCPVCDKVFRNQTCYRHHSRVCCKLDKPKGLHVTKSKVTVEVKNRLNMKKVRVGLRGGTNNECICDYCGKIFYGRKFIMTHIQHVHMKNTHRPCPYCGKSLASAHMTEHIKSHELVRSFKCDHCNLVLKTRLGFIQHLRLHTGEKPYACEECGESFSASSRRSEHIKKAHKPELLYKHHCDMCPAKFTLPSQLKKHQKAVHSIGSGRVFQCEECQEQFSSCRGLIHHSRKHQKDVDLTQFPKRPYIHLKDSKRKLEITS